MLDELNWLGLVILEWVEEDLRNSLIETIERGLNAIWIDKRYWTIPSFNGWDNVAWPK